MSVPEMKTLFGAHLVDTAAREALANKVGYAEYSDSYLSLYSDLNKTKLIAKLLIQSGADRITEDRCREIIASYGFATTSSLSIYAKRVDMYTRTEINTKLAKKQNVLTQADKQAIADLKDISGKVDKVDGKGLSTNDYTTAEKTKLSGVESGANKYVLPNDVPHDANYVHTDNNYNAAAKSKVDAIPDNPKYTDTVYDDTEIKGDVDELKDEIVNVIYYEDDSTVPEGQKVVTKSQLDTKVGYAEYSNSYLKLYADNTKSKLIASLLIEGGTSTGGISEARAREIITSYGYATTSSLSVYALKSELHTHSNKTVLDAITSEKVASWDNKADSNDIPTKTSDLTNDSNFLTQHQSIKTINNQSIVGIGNIEIQGGEEEEEFKLIADVTTEEEVHHLYFSAYADGTAMNVKDLKLYIYIPDTGTNDMMISAEPNNTSTEGWAYCTISADNRSYKSGCRMVGYLYSTWGKDNLSVFEERTTYSNTVRNIGWEAESTMVNKITPERYHKNWSDKYITEFVVGVGANSANTLPIGTRVVLYGRNFD